MKRWEAQRGSAFSDLFAEQLASIGIDWADFDRIAPDIEDVLCGASRELLDVVYPPVVGNLRMFHTFAAKGLPALRIAFSIDAEDDGEKIVYWLVSLVEK